jgi:hypothetical protein
LDLAISFYWYPGYLFQPKELTNGKRGNGNARGERGVNGRERTAGRGAAMRRHWGGKPPFLGHDCTAPTEEERVGARWEWDPQIWKQPQQCSLPPPPMPFSRWRLTTPACVHGAPDLSRTRSLNPSVPALRVSSLRFRCVSQPLGFAMPGIIAWFNVWLAWNRDLVVFGSLFFIPAAWLSFPPRFASLLLPPVELGLRSQSGACCGRFSCSDSCHFRLGMPVWAISRTRFEFRYVSLSFFRDCDEGNECRSVLISWFTRSLDGV